MTYRIWPHEDLRSDYGKLDERDVNAYLANKAAADDQALAVLAPPPDAVARAALIAARNQRAAVLGAASLKDWRDRYITVEQTTFPRCCGTCHQGRLPCPSPQACQRIDAETLESADSDVYRWLGGLLAVVALLVIAAHLWSRYA